MLLRASLQIHLHPALIVLSDTAKCMYTLFQIPRGECNPRRALLGCVFHSVKFLAGLPFSHVVLGSWNYLFLNCLAKTISIIFNRIFRHELPHVLSQKKPVPQLELWKLKMMVIMLCYIGKKFNIHS